MTKKIRQFGCLDLFRFKKSLKYKKDCCKTTITVQTPLEVWQPETREKRFLTNFIRIY